MFPRPVLFIARGNVLMCAELKGRLHALMRFGRCPPLCPYERLCEKDPEMTKSANTDNANSFTRPATVFNQGSIHRHTATEHWAA